jgi:hypothetical protein
MPSSIDKKTNSKLFIPSLILGAFFEAFLIAMTIFFPEAGKILLWHIWALGKVMNPTHMDVSCFFLGLILGVPIYGVLAYLILKMDKGFVQPE